MVVWLTLFTFTGFGGLIANKVLWDVTAHSYPPWFFPFSLALSLAVGAVATRFGARQAARLVDVSGRGSVRKRDLVGLPGVVASPLLDQAFGEVRVKDGSGVSLLVHARLPPGAPALPRGARVAIAAHDEKAELFTVEPLDDKARQLAEAQDEADRVAAKRERSR